MTCCSRFQTPDNRCHSNFGVRCFFVKLCTRSLWARVKIYTSVTARQVNYTQLNSPDAPKWAFKYFSPHQTENSLQLLEVTLKPGVLTPECWTPVQIVHTALSDGLIFLMGGSTSCHSSNPHWWPTCITSSYRSSPFRQDQAIHYAKYKA